MPCNSNLKKWKLKQSDTCDVCNQPQTIKHLLLDCTYSRPLWHIINSLFNINISFKQILGLDKSFRYNNLTSIVSFLIYKEWLVLSLKNEKRQNRLCIDFFKNELLLRNNICNCLKQCYIRTQIKTWIIDWRKWRHRKCYIITLTKSCVTIFNCLICLFPFQTVNYLPPCLSFIHFPNWLGWSPVFINGITPIT